jgi:O-antigen ligase
MQDSGPDSTHPPKTLSTDGLSSNEAASWGLALSRANCCAGILFWLIIFTWLWIGIPPESSMGRWLGSAWFLLGLFSPMGWCWTFALALPWFGNNPGGEHHLYLIEMGLMGLVIRHLASRLTLACRARRNWIDPWIRLFCVMTCVGMIPQMRWLWCELVQHKSSFLFSIYSHFGTAPVFSLQVVLKLILAAGFYSWLRDRPWSEQVQTRYWWMLILVLAGTAVFGLLNYLNLVPADWWRPENPDIGRGGFRRLQSLYFHSGWYAQYLVCIAPAALALAMTTRRYFRVLAWVLVVLLTVTGLLTFQRAGWLALAGGYFSVVLGINLSGGIQNNRLRRTTIYSCGLVLFLGIMLAVLALSIPTFYQRLTDLAHFEHRTEIWKSALGLFQLSPITGVGTGNYYFTHTLFYKPGHPWHLIDKVTAHSVYLHLLTTRGALSLLMFLVILGGMLWRGWKGLLFTPGPGQQYAGSILTRVALMGALTSLAVNGIFQHVFYVRTIELLFWLFAGICSWFVSAESRARRIRHPITIGALNLFVIILSLALLVAWENQDGLKPWKVWVRESNFRMSGEHVSISVPAGRNTIQFPVACIDPNADTIPVTYTFSMEGRTLKQSKLGNYEEQWIDLELPPGRNPSSPLDIRVSRTWSPWYYGLKDMPILEMGVLYLPPQ